MLLILGTACLMGSCSKFYHVEPLSPFTPTWSPTPSPTLTMTATASFTRTQTPTATPTDTPTASITSTATATPTGDTCYIGGSDANFHKMSTSQFSIIASPFDSPAPVTIHQMAVNILSAAAGQLFNLAVYTDSSGSPDTLMLQGAPQTIIVGWNLMPVSDTYLPAGTYWLALKTSEIGFGIKCDGDQPGMVYYHYNENWDNGNFPSPFPSGGTFTNYNKLSIQAIYCN